MKKTIYECDHCGKVIGDKPHLSIQFGHNSGVAVPPSTAGWHIAEKIPQGIMQFCDEKCLASAFAFMLDKHRPKFRTRKISKI